VGKTALATWAALRAYERRDFTFIVSLTAKDRELTSTGIQALAPGLTSFEALLDNVVEVLGFPDIRTESLDRKDREVRSLLENSNGLLYVDNLETVDDARIIRFLDTLPPGVRAITTSRRTSVRVSVRPIDLGPLTEGEVDKFIVSLTSQPTFAHVAGLSGSERMRIGAACDGLPLAIRWALARSKSASEALATAESITASTRRGEELLEFCFRRVFDATPGAEKAVLEVLSLFQRPIPTEAVLVGANVPHFKVLNATEGLVADALVQRLFDPDRNDYCYTLLPVTRAFVYAQVAKQPGLEERIRRNLADWFEAKDVGDPDERLVIREIRQGRERPESALVDLAQAAERRDDLDGAQDLYEQALRRNPRSWKGARLFAEFCRHKLNNLTEALRLYEQAAANAPRRGSDRALIFREWGMLLRDSGDPQATDLAIEKFETALAETPNDVLAVDALARMLDRKGAYRRVIDLLEPLLQHPNYKTRKMSAPLLLKAYERTGEMVKAARVRSTSEL
jgi:tetratricopeptide (TPR) repeat protein